jgi:hypothetical protein
MGIDNFELFLNEITEQNRHRIENRKLLLIPNLSIDVEDKYFRCYL